MIETRKTYAWKNWALEHKKELLELGCLNTQLCITCEGDMYLAPYHATYLEIAEDFEVDYIVCSRTVEAIQEYTRNIECMTEGQKDFLETHIDFNFQPVVDERDAHIKYLKNVDEQRFRQHRTHGTEISREAEKNANRKDVRGLYKEKIQETGLFEFPEKRG